MRYMKKTSLIRVKKTSRICDKIALIREENFTPYNYTNNTNITIKSITILTTALRAAKDFLTEIKDRPLSKNNAT